MSQSLLKTVTTKICLFFNSKIDKSNQSTNWSHDEDRRLY